MEGPSFLSISLGFRCLSLHMFFAAVVFIFVVIRSSDKTLCGLCWVRVECGGYFPATWSLRCSVIVVHSSVWGQSTEKTVGASGLPSMQDVEKALPTTRLRQAGRSSQFVATRPVSKNVRATAQKVACITDGRCSEVLTHSFWAGTGHQEHTTTNISCVFINPN